MTIQNDAKAFLKARGDAVEQVLADSICPLVPGYAVFWATFIGAISQPGHVEHCPITGFDLLSLQDQSTVNQSLDAIRSSHYTLFTHISSAKKKLDYLVSEDGKPFAGQRHADYVEALEEFYFHFGVILTQLERMMAAFAGVPLDAINLRGQMRPQLGQILGASLQATIHQVYDDALQNARHSVEHYARPPITFEPEPGNRYFVRLPREKGESWLAYQARPQPQPGDMVPVVEVVRTDFEHLLALVNACYPYWTTSMGILLKRWELVSTAGSLFQAWLVQKDAFPTTSLSSLAAVISTSTASSVYIKKPPTT